MVCNTCGRLVPDDHNCPYDPECVRCRELAGQTRAGTFRYCRIHLQSGRIARMRSLLLAAEVGFADHRIPDGTWLKAWLKDVRAALEEEP